MFGLSYIKLQSEYVQSTMQHTVTDWWIYDRMSSTRHENAEYVLSTETISDNTKYWLMTCAFTNKVSDLSKNGSLIWHGRQVCVYLYKRG